MRIDPGGIRFAPCPDFGRTTGADAAAAVGIRPATDPRAPRARGTRLGASRGGTGAGAEPPAPLQERVRGGGRCVDKHRDSPYTPPTFEAVRP